MTITALIQHHGGLEKDIMVTVYNAESGDILNEYHLQAGKGTQISLSTYNALVISEVDKLHDESATATAINGNVIEAGGYEAEKLPGDVAGNNQTQYEGKTE